MVQLDRCASSPNKVKQVICEFNADPIPNDAEVLIAKDLPTIKVELKLRRFFEGTTASLSREILQPGELTQGLCSPWQNDYRECACYYWAASRPDYVNVEPGPDGLSRGDMWMSKKRTGEYIPDDRKDKRLYSYDDLFIDWQGYLKFIIRGKDAERSHDRGETHRFSRPRSLGNSRLAPRPTRGPAHPTLHLLDRDPDPRLYVANGSRLYDLSAEAAALVRSASGVGQTGPPSSA